MPIINPTPPSQIVARANAFRGSLMRQFNDMKRLSESIYTWIWEDSTHTPQEAFDAFGADAADLLKVGDAYNAMLTSYLGQGAARPMVPAGKTATRNANGTVTVSG